MPELPPSLPQPPPWRSRTFPPFPSIADIGKHMAGSPPASMCWTEASLALPAASRRRAAAKAAKGVQMNVERRSLTNLICAR